MAAEGCAGVAVGFAAEPEAGFVWDKGFTVVDFCVGLELLSVTIILLFVFIPPFTHYRVYDVYYIIAHCRKICNAKTILY